MSGYHKILSISPDSDSHKRTTQKLYDIIIFLMYGEIWKPNYKTVVLSVLSGRIRQGLLNQSSLAQNVRCCNPKKHHQHMCLSVNELESLAISTLYKVSVSYLSCHPFILV